MTVAGLQTLTLLDYPGRVACTVFTPGCNFRCPYCHNASLVLPDRFGPGSRERDVFRLLERRRGVLDGVVVSGGEPLLQEDLPLFLRRVRELGYLVKLDTNGSFPDRLARLLAEGLVDRVAMDIKNSPPLYARTVGVTPDLGSIRRSKDLLLRGTVSFEFRTTVVRGLHTPESVAAAAKWIEGAGEYYLQQYAGSENVIRPDGLSAFSEEEMNGIRAAAARYVPGVRLRGL